MTPTHSDYLSIRENSVQGRYVIHEQIDAFLEEISRNFVVRIIGKSVRGRAIKSIVLGTGPQKVLMWSQMHGNESTTTKAVLDMVNYLGSDLGYSRTILQHCTITIIPMLNPDGAVAYTRVNANTVDLNRDAQLRSQPESLALRDVYDGFQPDYCFNLHDQRTIFNVGETSKPATVSFLAPAHDAERSISETRKRSMQLIVAMNTVLQDILPGQIGRYDDAFNANCVGDTFQMLDTPTVLFEAGHFPEDYQRERTREYIFRALLAALQTISKNRLDAFDRSDYFSIPENQKRFVDIIIKNAKLIHPSMEKESVLGIVYKEVLKENTVHFVPVIQQSTDLNVCFGHKTYDCSLESDLKNLKQQSFWKDIIAQF